MRYGILYYLAVFSKKDEFSEKTAKPPFLGPKSLLKVRGRPATKMNITFLMGNEILNIFSFNNFFKKKQHFWRKLGKKF